MVNFTVAIPTYNGEKRLVEVLEGLRSQIDTEHLSWEIIVVNNNSTDETAQVVREYQANWDKTYPLKYYFEAEQGTEFAQQRAVEEAQGEFIGFLDDDNLPTYNWVAAAYAFGKEHPEVGAYGSQIYGEFELEVELPKNFHKIACFLAIVERGSKAHRYEPRQKMLPPGAGLVVRKKVWLESVPKRLFLNHKGKEGGTMPFCQELTQDLMQLVNVDTGELLVQKVLRTADFYQGEYLDHLPDLLVEWNRSAPISTIYSPKIGKIEKSYKGVRTGDHKPDGLFFAFGPETTPGQILQPTSIMDFAPTIAAQLGVSLPNIDGKAIALPPRSANSLLSPILRRCELAESAVTSSN